MINPPKVWEVVPYRPEWPEMFACEAQLLAKIFAGTNAVIEHVGSTAVPGLGAKPIIDIMIGVHALSDAEARVADLAHAQYEYVPEYEAELPDRRYFRKPFMRPRSHHLHIVVHGSAFWNDHLLFRDYLRAHPDVAREYYELKQRLSVENRTAGIDYPTAKTPFVSGVLASARQQS